MTKQSSNISRPKLFISDWDGTLFDSGALHNKANAAVFRNFGITQPSTETIEKEMTSDCIEFYHTYGIPKEVTIEELRKVWNPYVESFWNEARPYPYAGYFLSRLAHYKIPVVIVTSGSPTHTLRRLHELEFSQYVTLTRFDAFDRARAIREVLQCCPNVSAEEAVYMDDLPSGIRAAKNTGVHTIGIAHGLKNIVCLTEENPDALVYSLSDATNLLEKGKI